MTKALQLSILSIIITLEESKELNNFDEKKTLSLEKVRNFVTDKRIIGKTLIKFVIHNEINI